MERSHVEYAHGGGRIIHQQHAPNISVWTSALMAPEIQRREATSKKRVSFPSLVISFLSSPTESLAAPPTLPVTHDTHTVRMHLIALRQSLMLFILSITRISCGGAQNATVWATMLGGFRAEMTASLLGLPEELWLHMFTFLKHEQQPVFPPKICTDCPSEVPRGAKVPPGQKQCSMCKLRADNRKSKTGFAAAKPRKPRSSKGAGKK